MESSASAVKYTKYLVCVKLPILNKIGIFITKELKYKERVSFPVYFDTQFIFSVIFYTGQVLAFTSELQVKWCG